MSDLKARMAALQAELDAATARVEELRTQKETVEHRIDDVSERMDVLERRDAKLQAEAVKRARILYRNGSSGMVDVLFGSDDFSELTKRAEMLSQVSLDDARVFVQLARSQEELESLGAELKERRVELAATTDALEQESDNLQSRFESAATDYEALQEQLAARAPEPRVVAAAPAAAPVVRSSGGMACPVAGPVSFTDTWGAPRAGHTHQGVDMMAASGTPVVAITAGTITLSDYGDSAGYWQILSGDDGNQYWYMHNQQNIVNGGHVSAGQQIATLGDSGNAAGTPHLHFEYHPGGGAAINPTPLVASVC